jgi:hypothetical protein
MSPRTFNLILGAFALLPCTLAAQTFKCVDAYGKVTYSERKCSDLGLKEAGEVKDQIQTAPAYRPPPRSEQPQPPAAAAPPPPPPPQPAEEAAPARRCFTVNTPKGTVTRCNDTPPDTPADTPPP